MDIYEIIGNIGVISMLAAYVLLQKEKISAHGAWYLGVNLLGAILVIISLLVHWNLPAFLLEAAWALITLYAMFTHLYKRGAS